MGRGGSNGRGTHTGKGDHSKNSRNPVAIVIPSDHKAARQVQKKIMGEVKRLGFDGHSLFAINLALEEAIVNAIKHGNKENKKKKVHVEFAITPKRCEIVVEDEGRGFDRKDVPDPTLQENLCKTCGRGILLIEAYMDKVEYTKGGRRVRMIKKKEAGRK